MSVEAPAERPCPVCKKMINADTLRCVHCGTGGIAQARLRKGPDTRKSVTRSDPNIPETAFALLPCPPVIIDDGAPGGGYGAWVLTGEDSEYCYYAYAGGIS